MPRGAVMTTRYVMPKVSKVRRTFDVLERRWTVRDLFTKLDFLWRLTKMSESDWHAGAGWMAEKYGESPKILRGHVENVSAHLQEILEHGRITDGERFGEVLDARIGVVKVQWRGLPPEDIEDVDFIGQYGGVCEV
jgi:hypothetical protein